MYKIMTGKGNVDFRKFFELAPLREGAVNTKGNSGHMHFVDTPVCRERVRRNFFSQKCQRTWNCLPDDVKRAGTVDGFKGAYYNYKISR